MGNSYQDHRISIGVFYNKLLKCSQVQKWMEGRSETTSGPGIKLMRLGRRSKTTSRLDIKIVLLLSLFMVNIGTGVQITQCYGSILLKSAINCRSCEPLTKSVELVNHNFRSRYTNGNKKKNGVKILHWNPGAKHLHNKVQNIESVINAYKPEVLGISESNFYKSHDVNEVQIENYNLFFSETLNNENLKVSRVVVYVHKSIACRVRKDLMSNTFSSIWLEIHLSRQKRFLVCHAYRDWQYLDQETNYSKSIPAQSSRWLEFLNQWETAMKTNLECLVLGDLNIDHMTWMKPNPEPTSSAYKLKTLIEDLFVKILPYGAVQCVNGPTRFERSAAPSGLDHFWTTDPSKLSDIHTYFHGSSDHKIIIGTRYTKSVVRSPRFVKKRSYKNFQPEYYLSLINAMNWWDLYSCEDPEQAVNIFTTKLNMILDEVAPIKRIQVRNKYAPWLSNATKALITERDLAQKKAAESNDDEDWKQFRKMRNQINNKLKMEKRQWQARRLEACSNTSDTWRTIKGWLGWRGGGPPTQLVVDGELKNKPGDLARCMNEFFINKIRTLKSRIPPSTENPIARLQNLMRHRRCSFSLNPVYPDEIKTIIGKLKNTKTCGIDNIDAYAIKMASVQLTPAITHIVNLSITEGYFPAAWKVAKVVPLLKKDDENQPKNYRPVSLLPISSKILERAVYQQLIKYLESNHLLHHSHHGFRKNHSTATALLEMYSNWVEAFEDEKITAVILLDMSAAFDLVDKSILVEKLKLYGLDRHSADWMENYMSGRSQQVYIDGDLSDPMAVEVGVPQGSILGPILYCLMVNELPEVPHNHEPRERGDPSFWNCQCRGCGGIACFADDSSFSYSGKDPVKINQDIKHAYNQISEYMASNKLVLNSEKTHLMVMASRAQHRLHGNYGVELDTGNEIIQPEEHDRLLGCEIKCDFTWKEHLQDNHLSLLRQLTTRINALRKISFAASFQTRKMVANGVLISRIIYAIQLWGGTSNYLLDMLQVLQNRAARLVTRRSIFTSQHQLLLECGWLNVRQMVAFHDAVQIFKTLKEEKPVSLYRRLSRTFSYRTRAATTGAIVDNYRTRGDISMESFVVRGTKLWNKLPASVRQSQNLKQFKMGMKAWLQCSTM